MSFEQALALTMSAAIEGGYTRFPSDPGNWTGGRVSAGSLVGTNHGISAPVLCTWLGRTATEADMRGLTRDEATAIYHIRYWRACACDRLPPPIAGLIFDAAVNQGEGYAPRLLQQGLFVPVDGQIGSVTLAAAARADVPALHAEIARLRADRYRASPDWATFGTGWMRRLMRVVAATASFS
ncbi:glycoside hydrolase family 108 protein [Granulibacter bethesdensis]|uniref:glycoside hydrolase family 108 protein n=1 Tax=Granulibacter bethesdensis TaxID=364410 RepID=UPI0003F1F4C6|nr:glycosyl hydrolase 108 family protein [Granulibacter bethesdensis]APG30606.1 putative exported protein [Granulibacter bethesdensis]